MNVQAKSFHVIRFPASALPKNWEKSPYINPYLPSNYVMWCVRNERDRQTDKQKDECMCVKERFMTLIASHRYGLRTFDFDANSLVVWLSYVLLQFERTFYSQLCLPTCKFCKNPWAESCREKPFSWSKKDATTHSLCLEFWTGCNDLQEGKRKLQIQLLFLASQLGCGTRQALSWDNTENTHPSLVFSYQWVLHSTKQLSVYSNYNLIPTDQMLRYQCNIISIRLKVPHSL